MTTKVLTAIVTTVVSGMLFLACAAGAVLGVAPADPCDLTPAATPASVSAPSSPWATQATTSVTPPSQDGSNDPGGVASDCRPGEPILHRAASWLTAGAGGPVSYLSSTDPSTWFNGYRRDCSGFASMALGLPGPGLNTAALAAGSSPIAKNQLRAGDLLINPGAGPAGHVVIFDHWASPTMDSYWAYEQSGDGGTHHRVIRYPYFGHYPMHPYRYR